MQGILRKTVQPQRQQDSLHGLTNHISRRHICHKRHFRNAQYWWQKTIFLSYISSNVAMLLEPGLLRVMDSRTVAVNYRYQKINFISWFIQTPTSHNPSPTVCFKSNPSPRPTYRTGQKSILWKDLNPPHFTVNPSNPPHGTSIKSVNNSETATQMDLRCHPVRRRRWTAPSLSSQTGT